MLIGSRISLSTFVSDCRMWTRLKEYLCPKAVFVCSNEQLENTLAAQVKEE